MIKMNINIIPKTLDRTKVKKIVSYQLSYIKKYNKHNFLGSISVHKLSNKNYLVDGKHRYNAILELYNNYSHDLETVMELVEVDTKQQLTENYNLINNTCLEDIFFQNTPEQIIRHFQNKYPDVWVDKNRTQRPSVKLNSFRETLIKMIEDLEGEIDLVQEIERLNHEISTWNNSEIKNVSEQMYHKAQKNSFYLGLLSYPSKRKDKIYEWGDLLICRNKPPPFSPPPPPSKDVKKKKSIPKKLKDDCWDINVGKQYAQVYCIVCNITVIDSRNFHAGHIESEKNGGQTNIDNIIPVCSGCNQSMGSIHMREYIEKNYPSNLENFDSRNYQKLKI